MQSRPDVLIVHSDSIVIQTLSLILAPLARVRFSLSAKDALAQFRSDAPELLMLEVPPTGSQGLDLLRQLRELPAARAVPVIALTAQANPAQEAAYYELGPIEFLAKPLTAQQVKARVRDQLRLHRYDQMAAARPLASDPGRPPPTVLVVDDDAASIQLIGSALEPLKCQVRFAMDGETALNLMANEVPDVVLMDVQMPGMDGIAVCRAMQSDPVLRSVPVCVVTRFTDVQTESSALQAGAVDFISKPYRPAVLLARVRNLIRIKDGTDTALRELSQHWRRLGDHRVAAMVEAASDAILSVDARGDVVLINKAACTLLGVGAADVLGQPLNLLPDAEVIEPLLRQALPGAAALLGMPSRIRLGQGLSGVRIVEPSVLNFGDGDDRICALSLRDVTERARAEVAEHDRRAAEASSRTKSMMLSYLAHEFAAPFNAIMGMATVALGDTAHPLPEPQRKRVELMHAGATRLLAMLRDLLDLSRADVQGFSVRTEPVDVVAEVQAACALVAPQAAAAGIRIDLASNGQVLATADQGRLGQCLLNLLTNAIKYNRPAGSIRVSVRVADGRVNIEVADTGLGMDEQQLARLFRPFDRLGREGGDIPGTGLGLVVSRLLVEAMGGQITAASRLGEGASFSISLPLA